MNTLPSFFRPFLLCLALCAALCGGGCSTASIQHTRAEINAILDAVLPADFRGPVDIRGKNPYFDFAIVAGDVHRDTDGWHWAWMSFTASGRFTNNSVAIGVPTAAPGPIIAPPPPPAPH